MSHNLTADFFPSLVMEIKKHTNSLENDTKYRSVIILVPHVMHKHLRDGSLQASLPQVNDLTSQLQLPASFFDLST